MKLRNPLARTIVDPETGRTYPVIEGGDQTFTVDDELERVVQRLDDLIDTARSQERDLTPVEQSEHDYLARRFDELTAGRPASRFRGHGYSVPNINLGHSAARADRSLDELLWATADSVQAGTVTDRGIFSPDQNGARNPVEQVTVRSESGPALRAPRIDEFDPQDRGTVRRFQQTVADMVTFGLLVDKHAMSSRDGFEVAREHTLMADRWQQVCRALDVDTAGEGAEWVPTGIGATLHEKVRAAGKVAPLFTRLDLPTNPWKWPIEGSDATAYRVGEPTGDTESKMTASTPGSVAATFDAEIFGARTIFSRSVEADSALAILPFVQMKLVRAFVTAEEKAILDGDSDGTHQDGDVSGTADARTAWDGFRKRALANAKVDTNGGLSAAKLHEIRALMGKWGVNPADLAIIIGVSSFYDIIDDTEILTVDKFGPQATILNGQLASVYGAPLIVSEHVREDLNASGVQDGITENRTYALIVNRNEWVIGQRMALDVEVDDSIYRETYQRVMVGFQRQDFQNIGDASTNDDTAVGFNVTP